MKRIFTALLAAGLTLSLLSACGKSQPVETDPLDEIRGKKFSDLEAGTVLYDTACYLSHTGILEPVSGAFDAYEPITRQFAVETIYQFCGAPETAGKTRFSDAAKLPAVTWADENGILADMTGTTFAADTLLTRQELAGMLMREGLDEFNALKTITINAAKHIGVADRVGSVEVGKDADLVIAKGCPMQISVKPQTVFVNGVRAFG